MKYRAAAVADSPASFHPANAATSEGLRSFGLSSIWMCSILDLLCSRAGHLNQNYTKTRPRRGLSGNAGRAASIPRQ